MPLALGAVADDYTGASDLANTFAKEGLRTVQAIGVPATDLALPEIDAIVMKSLAKRVEDRYQSAAAMRSDEPKVLMSTGVVNP